MENGEMNVPQTVSEEQPKLIPYSISEEKKNEFLRFKKTDAIKTFLFCIVFCAVVLFLIWLITFKLGYVVVGVRSLICVVLGVIGPIFGTYNLITTNAAISKGDYEFFEGVVAFPTDKDGYRIYGLARDNVFFPSYEKGLGDPAPGAHVIVARFRQEYWLLHMGQ